VVWIADAIKCIPQETDKATMDVEAQEDGVMAKIIVSRPVTFRHK
jgi:hypothetical protein